MIGRTWLGLGVIAALGALLAVGQFVLVFQSWSDPVANAYYWRLAALFQGVAGIVYTALGVVIVWRRPRVVIGWLVAAIGLGILIYQSVSEYALRGLLVESIPLTGANEAAVLSQTFWALAFGPIPILLLVYPTGRLVSKVWLWAAAGAVLAMIVIAVLSTVALWPYRHLGADLLNLEDTDLDEQVSLVFTGGLILLFSSLAASFASLLVRWRRSSKIERLQLKWLMLGGLVISAQAITVFFEVDGVLNEVLLLGGLIALPTAIALAMLRYRLFEIDRLISRTVTYGLVTALLVLVYLGTVFVLRLVFPVEGDLAVAGSTLATAAVFSPIRRRVQDAVDHRFNRASYDAEQALNAFTKRLRNEVNLSALSDEINLVARDTVQPATISIWLR
jgi:hypothetical protein